MIHRPVPIPTEMLMPRLPGVLAAHSSAAETLSGESIWLKKAALPQTTLPSGAAYNDRLQIPRRGWLTAALASVGFNSEEPHQ